MCISNTQAVRLIVWSKHAYHKYHLSHIILLASYSLFLLFSSTAFYLVESVQAKAIRARYMERLADDRNVFVRQELLPHIFNNSRLLVYIHDSKSASLMTIANERLEHYEAQLKLRPPIPLLSCTFASSLIYVFSCVTTLGGQGTPMTSPGRLLSILISIIGIPFTITVVKDLAFLLALLFEYPCKWLEACWWAFRFCTLTSEGENSLEGRYSQGRKPQESDHRIAHSQRLLAIPVAVAIFALVGWATIGCIVIRWHSPRLDGDTALYNVIFSLATIGTWRIESKEEVIPLLCLLVYIVIGLSVVSLFINLLHSKFSRAYWLPGRLSLPLLPNHMFSEPSCLASFDSEDHLSDCPVNHFTTLGVLQTDDKCPLICITRRENAYADAFTQTHASSRDTKGLLSTASRFSPPDAIFFPRGGNQGSDDDVNKLIVETYEPLPHRVLHMKGNSERPAQV